MFLEWEFDVRKTQVLADQGILGHQKSAAIVYSPGRGQNVCFNVCVCGCD